MTDSQEPEFQVHIVGEANGIHRPVIHAYRMEGNGPLVQARLVATFPESERAAQAVELQRFMHDMLGDDMPRRIIANITGMAQLMEVLGREIANTMYGAEDHLTRGVLSDFVGVVVVSTGEPSNSNA